MDAAWLMTSRRTLMIALLVAALVVALAFVFERTPAFQKLSLAKTKACEIAPADTGDAPVFVGCGGFF